MSVSPAEVLAVVLLAAALVVVPTALAFALFGMARADRRPPPPTPAAAFPRHSAPRRRAPARRDDRPGSLNNRLGRR